MAVVNSDLGKNVQFHKKGLSSTALPPHLAPAVNSFQSICRLKSHCLPVEPYATRLSFQLFRRGKCRQTIGQVLFDVLCSYCNTHRRLTIETTRKNSSFPIVAVRNAGASCLHCPSRLSRGYVYPYFVALFRSQYRPCCDF